MYTGFLNRGIFPHNIGSFQRGISTKARRYEDTKKKYIAPNLTKDSILQRLFCKTELAYDAWLKSGNLILTDCSE
jgi:hypothetical protein